MRNAAQVHDLGRFATDFHLLDAYSPRAPGGTGESFDWELARLHPPTPPVVLSGGLTPDNVGSAIEFAGPFAVDVASGTELSFNAKVAANLGSPVVLVVHGRDRTPEQVHAAAESALV